ncbi:MULTISPECIES: NADP-dependent oxidoreductase [unclassified Streptomyces]|uniref:NADP-dependent oxidoreductase n=1 Tax=unclassified Streptomyces TaxID=2593676 RepID=UPI0035D6DDEF
MLVEKGAEMKAVQFDQYGDEDVLEVREIDAPVAAPGQIVVRVKAASINPGEAAIRQGVMDSVWPAMFPSGQGSDFAGTVTATGTGADWLTPGEPVLGWTDERASHAELVCVPAEQVIRKPPSLSWEVAGSMFVAPVAGYASVIAVNPMPGETVVVSAAAGGVGSVAVQLAQRAGATVIGLAGEGNHAWLREHDIVPVAYGEGQEDRIRAAAPQGVDALIDTYGGGYLDLGVGLGVEPRRMNSVIDFAAAERLGAQTVGSSQVVNAEVLAHLAELAASEELDIPIAATFPLAEVRAAYRQLADRHTRGKIVLLP